jgi:hypothetical protein
MRVLLELFERNRLSVKAEELANVDASVVRALRRAGFVRDGDPGMVDLSTPDLGRVIRKLWGVLGRGEHVPAAPDGRAQLLGWMPDAAGERQVYLVGCPPMGLRQALHTSRLALVLVPTTRTVTPEMRRDHGPGARVVLETLEEALQVKEGRLARAGAVLPDVFEDEAPPGARRRPTGEKKKATRGHAKARQGRGKAASGKKKRKAARKKAAAADARARVTGARRWNEIRICVVNPGMVRVDLPDRSVRCTPHDLGMVHKRRRTPLRAWAALMALCVGEGYLKTNVFGGEDATTKLVSRLRAKLKAAFGISASPFHRYNSRDGWRARFQARGSLPDAQTDRWHGREPE